MKERDGKFEKTITLSDIEACVRNLFGKDKNWKRFQKWMDLNPRLQEELYKAVLQDMRYQYIEEYMHTHPGLMKQFKEAENLPRRPLDIKTIEEGLEELAKKKVIMTS